MGRLHSGVVLMLVMMGIFCDMASADTLTVGSSGCDYTKIQDAVDAARAGDTILVYNGSYRENVDVRKRLTLQGEGADVVTVQAESRKDHIFEVTANRVNISGFTVTGATRTDKAGIYLNSADHCNISENIATGNERGICLYKSTYNTLTNNTANSDEDYGIYLGSSSNYNTLTENTANNNDYGVYLDSSSINTLANNTISLNSRGIHLDHSSSNKLTGNTVRSNTMRNIYLDHSSRNTLAGNTVESGRYGIYLYSSSNGNKLYHNNLVNNRLDDRDYCTNTWHNGREGNYYSDYSGTDSDGDGIGDSSYSIPPDGRNKDRYPLAQPWKGYRVHNLNTGEGFLGIQTAIDDSDTKDGHTIIVDAGVHRTNVDVDKRLTLQGAGGSVVTVTAARSNDHVFDVTAAGVNITGFRVTGATGSGKMGIYLGSDAMHCNISNNNCSKNYYGIYLNFSSSNTLANNTISGNVYNFGVYGNSLSEYTHNIDTSNVVDGKPIYYWVNQQDKVIPDDAGYVGVVNSTKITVSDLTLTGNGEGVLFAYISHSVIENITASSNNCGIHIHKSSSNAITENTASNNTAGIYTSSSSENALTKNNVSSNKDCGIYLYRSSENSIHNNYFNNTNNAWDDGVNAWNTTKTAGTSIIGGTHLGGNYWSDYVGKDLDSDGLGDTLLPYTSSGNIANVGDRHPLVVFSVHNLNTGENFSMIQDAIYAPNTSAGDVITVDSGMYNENVIVNKSLTICSASGNLSDTIVQANNLSDHVFEVTAGFVNISGFTVTGATCSGKAGIYLGSNAAQCRISDNNCSNNSYGIYLNSSIGNTLLNNRMSGNTYNFVLRGDSLFEYTHRIDPSNTVDEKPIYYWVDQHDKMIPGDAGYVGVVNSTKIMVKDLTLTKNSEGVLFAYTRDSLIENVTASSNKYGIRLSHSSENTLANNIASDNRYGTYLHESSNNMLVNNNVSSNSGRGNISSDGSDGDDGYGYGIYLSSSSNNTLTSNTANSNSGYGGRGNNIYSRGGDGYGYGIYLIASSNNMLVNNTANSNSGNGEDCGRGSDGYGYGIYLFSSSNNTLTSNTANLSSGNGGGSGKSQGTDGNRGGDGCSYGIYLLSSSNNTLTSNIAGSNHGSAGRGGSDSNGGRGGDGNGYGIYLIASSSSTLVNNTAGSNSGQGGRGGSKYGGSNHNHGCGGDGYGYGIYLIASSSSTLVNNTASSNSGQGGQGGGSRGGYGSDNGYGIYLSSSSDTILINNTANSNRDRGCAGYGIQMQDSSDNTLMNNTANSNDCGIYLKNSNSNIVISNNANSNHGIGSVGGKGGIYLQNSNSNTLYHNSLADNGWIDAHDNCTNTWDNGYEGNYYSNYPGTDLNGDGIGDTAYSIQGGGGSVDNYPLMQPWKGYRVHNLNTNEDFLGIQAVIDDSDTNDGHTIIVDAGVYRMNVDVNKRLTLQGAGSSVVTVSTAQSSDHVFDVTVDYVNISGFAATGATGSGKAGVYLGSNADRCSISDNDASGNYYGVYLNSSSENTLSNNTMSGNSYNFHVYSSSLSDYTHRIDASNTVNGKPIYYWVDQQDKVIPGDAGYVCVVNSTNIMVRDLTLAKNSEGVLFVCTRNSRIENISVKLNKYGICLRDSSENTLANNTANSNRDCGICLYSSSNNTLVNNNAHSNKYGIYIDNSSGNTLENNTANSNNYGIHLYYSSSNLLMTNNASSNRGSGGGGRDGTNGGNGRDGYGYGIYLNSSSGNTLASNIASSNRGSGGSGGKGGGLGHGGNGGYGYCYGIYLLDSSNNLLTDNTANSNRGNGGSGGECRIAINVKGGYAGHGRSGYCYGIYLQNSSNNTLTSNTANKNSGRGGGGGLGHGKYRSNGGNSGSGYCYGIYLSSSS